jgi:arylformamidase
MAAAARDGQTYIIKRGTLMNRRSLLGAALSSWFVATSKLSAAGKPVFLGYDQEELDKAYDQSFWAPQMEQLEADDGTMSTAVRKATPPVTKQYGPTNADLIDVFTPASGRGAPILVFLHGGAWTRNTKDDVSYAATTFMRRGAAYLAPDFGSLKTVRLPQWSSRAAQPSHGPFATPTALAVIRTACFWPAIRLARIWLPAC